MAKLKLGALADDKPVKLTVELPAAVHRDLVAYAAALGEETGKPVGEPAKLIAPMVARFIAGDRAFAKLRNAGTMIAAVAAIALWQAGPAIAAEAADAAAAGVSVAAGAQEPADRAAEVWRIREGETVQEVARRWAARAGYTPVPAFTAQDKWRVIVSQEFTGTFEEALQWLSDGFSWQATQPVFDLPPNHTFNILSAPTGVGAGDPTFARIP
jgi:hypothetical protein